MRGSAGHGTYPLPRDPNVKGRSMTKQSCVAGLGITVALLALGVAPGAPQSGKGEKDKAKWQSLFNGKSLAGWKATNFGGEGEVTVRDGTVIMEQGNDLTGITYTRGDFPRVDYEVTLEGKRVAGN